MALSIAVRTPPYSVHKSHKNSHSNPASSIESSKMDKNRGEINDFGVPRTRKIAKWVLLERPKHPQTPKLCGKRSINITFLAMKKNIFFRGMKNNVNTSFPAYNLGLGVLGTPQHRLFCYFSSPGNTKIIDFH